MNYCLHMGYQLISTSGGTLKASEQLTKQTPWNTSDYLPNTHVSEEFDVFKLNADVNSPISI